MPVRRFLPACLLAVLSWLVLAAAVGLVLVLGGGTAGAAPGDVLARYTLDLSGSACAGAPGEPNTPVGIVVKGTKLRVSCWSDATIMTFDVRTGARLGAAKTISGISRLGALTFDKLNKKLYGCGDGGLVGVIDLVAGTFTPSFSAACVDGLMWDPIDNTFWAGGDGAPTIEHYTFDGTLISSTDVTGILGGCGRSGIEAVGGHLMLATYNCGPIYMTTRALASATPFAPADPANAEDLACDRNTFALQNKTALWVVYAYSTDVVAYEAPASGLNRPACK